MVRLLQSLVFLLFLGVLTASAQSPSESFEAANQAVEAGDFEEALRHYEAALAAGGDSPALYWNAGMVAQRLGEGEKAVHFFSFLKDDDPQDFRTVSKLIQCYEMMGELEKRDEEIAYIHRLWSQADPDSEIRKAGIFCRDQFVSSDRSLMVFEHFELESPRGLKYVFLVLDPEEQKEDFRISLGSYDATNAMFHEINEIDPEVRVYHLDGYYDEGLRHATFTFFTGLPDYEKVKGMVESILAGKTAPVSSSEKKKGGDVEISVPAPTQK